MNKFDKYDKRSERTIQLATPQNNWKNSEYSVGESEIENVWDLGSHKNGMCMRKKSQKWVPYLLTSDHKRNRVITSKGYLALCNRDHDAVW